MANVQLCQTKKCGRLARFWSKVKSQFLCAACANPDALSGGYGAAAGQAEVLTPIQEAA